ncbi:acetyl-CoA carboxylase biotin carboxyl carrier protein [Corynebacterium callunae]|uniref:acetyl-CoA carboxylase biotin carboxyl carrier protein n=1 Tax=Corynebacterium callunae TaxID=1721 RepID=UPI00398203EC
MSENKISINELKSIVEWVNTSNDVRELSLKFGDVELFMSRNEQSHAPAATPAAPAAPVPAAAPTPAAAPAAPAEAAAPVEKQAPAAGAAETGEGEVLIKAPMVGTFYSAPRPGAPAFVTEGDEVTEESVLGIVEVMKLMNNIEAKVSGKVARILVENGEAVEYGQPLMVIATS